MKRFFLLLLPFVPFVLILFLYLHNLSTDVYGGDIGDLVTAGYVMGVPHPPGYPLFTVLVFLFSKLPIAATVAYKAGLISVISSVVGLCLYFLYVKRTTRNLIIAYLASLILAFSYLFWFYSEVAEVFALNNLFIIGLFSLAIIFYKTKNIKTLFALSFVAGLALTNHHTIILLYPAIALLTLAHYKLFLKRKTVILKSFLLFLVGLIPYAYIPLAASKNPVINWDNASNIQNFLHLVLRQGYGTLSPGSFTPAIPQERILILKEFIAVSVSSLTFPVIVICVIGVFYLLKKKEYILLLALTLAYILIGPFFTVYAGFPLVNAFVIGVAERFYLGSTIILMFVFPYGIQAIYNFCTSVFSKKIYALAILCTFFLIPILLFKYNFERTDLSKTTIGSKFGRDMLEHLPNNAVFFVNGDTAVFNTWYVHYVLKVRPDVTVIRVGDFMTNEFTGPYRAQYRHEKIAEDEYEWITKEIMKTHRVFFNNQTKLLDKKLIFIQYGLVSELVNGKVPPKDVYEKDIDRIWQNINVPLKDMLPVYEKNLTASHIASYYADSLSLTGNDLYFKYGDKEKAKKFLEKALKSDDRIARTYASMALLLSSGFKDCKGSEIYANKAIALNPLALEYQAILYDNYANCYKDNVRIELFKKRYKEIYGVEFNLKKDTQNEK